MVNTRMKEGDFKWSVLCAAQNPLTVIEDAVTL